MSDYLSNSLVLDGYRLVRFLGRGGFGEVWLCRSESMGDYRALKFIPTTHADRFDKEYEALLHYRKAAARLRSPHLVPIEHVNRNDAGLYYVMPLADGGPAADPSDPAWQPASLTTMIHERAGMATWFSSREIIALVLPVLQALQTLSDSGLVHRDVKPENILLFNGEPCLGDISLLGADASVITRRGTPGYATPSWYVGGHPDMYGVAATLFTLLTGNLPDRMGRAAFLWPPQGEASLSAEERAEWKRLHGVIRRATDEKVAERFVDFKTMAGTLPSGTALLPPPLPTGAPAKSKAKAKAKAKKETRSSNGTLVFIAVLVVIACMYGLSLQPPPGSSLEEERQQGSGSEVSTRPADSPPASATPSVLYADGNLAYGALASSQSDPNTANYMSFDENELYQDTLVKILNCIRDENDLDFKTAIQFLDEGVNSMPRVKQRPNVQLARLLLQQCADGRAINPAQVEAPAFLSLGNDDLGYRVALLCRLGAEEKAEEFLGNFITTESQTPSEKSEAFVERARVRAMLGRFADSRADAEQSVALAEGNQALKTQRQMAIIQMQKDIPAYADFLKNLPKKYFHFPGEIARLAPNERLDAGDRLQPASRIGLGLHISSSNRRGRLRALAGPPSGISRHCQSQTQNQHHHEKETDHRLSHRSHHGRHRLRLDPMPTMQRLGLGWKPQVLLVRWEWQNRELRSDRNRKVQSPPVASHV